MGVLIGTLGALLGALLGACIELYLSETGGGWVGFIVGLGGGILLAHYIHTRMRANRARLRRAR